MATATDKELDLEFDTAGIAPAEAETNERSTLESLPKPRRPKRGSGPLYFDLETVPDYERLDRFGLDPLPEPVTVTPANRCMRPGEVLGGTVRDITGYIASTNPDVEWLLELRVTEARGKGRRGVLDVIKAAEGGSSGDVAATERRKLLSTTPEFCRIAAIGWAVGGGDVTSCVATEPEHERGILECFWELVSLCKPIVGFNVLGFDLPVIFFRSAMLKVPSSKMIDTKPWGRDVVDLMFKRFPKGNFGSGRPGKLKDLARLAGINVPAGDMDGSQVEELMKTDPVKVGEYVRSDAEITRQLHCFYAGYFCE